MPTGNAKPMECEADDAAKLNALRSAARIGVAALERGEFKEFEDAHELRTYLDDLSDKIISDASDRSVPRTR